MGECSAGDCSAGRPDLDACEEGYRGDHPRGGRRGIHQYDGYSVPAICAVNRGKSEENREEEHEESCLYADLH